MIDGMEDDGLGDVRKALHRHQRDERAAKASLAALHDAIVQAVQAGIRQADIVRATGYTRERIRQLTKRPVRRDDTE